MAGYSGHVFIVRGDLLSVACDALVVPTDAALRVEPHWHPHLEGLEGIELRGGKVHVTAEPDGGRYRGVDGPFRRRGSRLGDGPDTWLLSTAVLDPESEVAPDEAPWDAAVSQLSQVLDAFATAFAATPRSASTRGRPLIAVPLLGSGAGGFERSFRQYARELLPLLQACADAAGADLVLVIHGSARRAAALEALCRVERAGAGLAPAMDQVARVWQQGPGLTSVDAKRSSKHVLAHLIDAAVAGDLVPFIGAGVSRSGGAPDWMQLIVELERAAGLGDLDLDRLDLLARAQVVENSLGSEPFLRALHEKLAVTPVSLQHLLLAALGARDAITTNFDDAYERAIRQAGKDVAVVPRRGPSHRLLKLHGSLADDDAPAGTGPILTRNQYLEHEQHGGPLRGALQMMLLTGHVVFIGYSLNDPDLHAAIHEVRRIREHSKVDQEPLATALQVIPSPELSLLWAPVVDVLWPVASDSDALEEVVAVRARDLEILLDVLADAAALAEVPVLAFLESELTEHERELRENLSALAQSFAPGEVPQRVAALLDAYGYGLEPDG
jgi:NAD-dependent SIR2 family protein deacetylase